MIFDIGIAFILDLVLGDPVYPYHPIRLIGKSILFFEKCFMKISKNQIWNGILLAFSVIFSWYLAIYGLIKVAAVVDKIWGLPILQKMVSIFIIYSCLSIRDLRDKAIDIKRSLEKESIETTRKKLSMIVGRQTEKLTKGEILRATVETVAENIVDGILSPLFYGFINGPPLMILYKAVNTLDSMVGHKNSTYIRFGRASARIDDAFNYIPARLSALFIPFASILLLKNGWKSFAVAWRDGQKHPSPNSGIAEAAVAGALGVQLGGVNYYHGKKSVKPFIGDRLQQLKLNHISEAVTIAYITGILFLFAGISIILYLTPGGFAV